MKKYFILYKIFFLSLPAFTQMTVSSGAKLVASGNVVLNLQDMDMVNNGTFTAGSGKMKFSGDGSNNLGGSSATVLYELEIAKNGTSALAMQNNITVNNKISFTSGLIDLNQNLITLTNTAMLYNENENSRIIGPTGGEVLISLNMNKPNGLNAGNLGAILTSSSNLGSVVIRRGHTSQAGAGLTSSINRYFNITASGKKIKPSIVRLNYFEAELNGQNENAMEFYQSLNGGADWENQSFTSRDVQANWVEKTGITNFNLLTLSSNGSSPIVKKVGNSFPENKFEAVAIRKITVGPNPNNGNFWFSISGIEKTTTAILYTMDGKFVKQFSVSNLQRQLVNGLPSGVYILKVEGVLPFRVVVQNSGSQSLNVLSNDYSQNKQ